MNYEQLAAYYKVMGEKTRLEIIDLLSCGPLCACDLLEHFHITQPTLSHHMKSLKSAGFVESWKDGTKVMYRLNEETLRLIKNNTLLVLSHHDNCICQSIEGGTC